MSSWGIARTISRKDYGIIRVGNVRDGYIAIGACSAGPRVGDFFDYLDVIGGEFLHI